MKTKFFLFFTDINFTLIKTSVKTKTLLWVICVLYVYAFVVFYVSYKNYICHFLQRNYTIWKKLIKSGHCGWLLALDVLLWQFLCCIIVKADYYHQQRSLLTPFYVDLNRLHTSFTVVDDDDNGSAMLVMLNVAVLAVGNSATIIALRLTSSLLLSPSTPSHCVLLFLLVIDVSCCCRYVTTMIVGWHPICFLCVYFTCESNWTVVNCRQRKTAHRKDEWTNRSPPTSLCQFLVRCIAAKAVRAIQQAV